MSMIIIFMIFIIIGICIILRKIFSSKLNLNNAELFDVFCFIEKFDIAFSSADEVELSSIAQCSAELPAISEACKFSIAPDQ